ncbi:MAG: APC family permease, partial [Gemmatimonadales bacterium]
LKALALVALVIAAFTLPHAELAGTAAPVPDGLSLIFALGLAMQGIVFTYDSYYMVVYCGEEIRDPGREIPRSMFRGVWLIILIYMLVNAAFLYVLPIGRMAGDPFVGGSMAEAIFGTRGDTIIRLIMIISVLGTINAELMAIPRILLAMSRDGLFPRQATRINAGGTPTVALGLSLLVVTGFLLTGSFEVVLAFDALLILVLYLFSFIALFALRRREPDTPRPYRAWGYPVVPGITVAIGLGLVIAMAAGDVKSAVVVFGILVLSWPASRAVRQLNRRSIGRGNRG